MEQTTNKVADAIKVITDALREDKLPGSYYQTWLCNIAMTFENTLDRYHDRGLMHPSFEDSLVKHGLCCEAAEKFLDLLCSQSK